MRSLNSVFSEVSVSLEGGREINGEINIHGRHGTVVEA